MRQSISSKMLYLILLSLLFGNAVADLTFCMNGITTALSYFTFAESSDLIPSYYTNICNNTFGVDSIWAAAKIYCTPAEIEAGTALAQVTCTEGGLELTPYSAVVGNLTDEYIKSLQVVNFDDINATKVWNESVLISSQLLDEAGRTSVVFTEAYVRHQRYGWAMYGFWGGILALGIINRFLIFLFEQFSGRTRRDVETVSSSLAPLHKPRANPFSTFRAWFRANLVIPPAYGSKHRQLVWSCTMPTRLETLVVTTYWVLSAIMISVGYDVFQNNLYYSYGDQILRYFSDRNGIIAYANLPILWMFSGRNNIFLWATGWEFSTFNMFHKNVARIAVIQAVIHSFGWTALEAHGHYLSVDWTQQYWYMGAVATITMSFILIFSSIFLRQKFYELFLLIHVVLSIVTIVGLFFHTKIFDGEYDGYLWPLVAIWCFDRLMRIVRVVYCNLHVTFSGKLQSTKATAIYDETSDLIRLQVAPGSRILKLRPNQHYFLYQPIGWKGWENHPFTLCSWTSGKILDISDSPSVSINDKALNEDSKQITRGSIEVSSPNSSTLSENESGVSHSARQTLTFLIRPSNGWTKRLRTACARQPDKPLQVPVLIEGPYGHSVPLHQYENAIFITGGTGISCATSYLQQHFTHVSSGKSIRTTNISLIWACKQQSMIQDVASNELAQAVRNDDITTSFFVTAHTAHLKETSPKLSPESPHHVEIKSGRPDITARIHSFLDGVYNDGYDGSKTAVLVCGPAAMADEARIAVHQALKMGRKEVEYFEETFGW